MWFKVDDKLWGHPKWLAATPNARALWISAGSWSAAHDQDGLVPKHVLPVLGGRAKDAEQLVAVGLWEKCENGWRFHNWLEYQPTAEQTRTVRERRREAGRMGGLRSGLARSKTEANAEANASGGASPVPEAKPNPVPSRTRPVPVPTPRDGSASNPPSPAVTRDDPIERLVAKLSDYYGLPYPENEALRTARFITDGKKLDDPVRYVLAAVQRDPDRYRPSVATPTPDHRKADYGPPLTDEQREAAARAAQQAKEALQKARSAT